MAEPVYGKLLIVGKELSDPFLEFPIDKKNILIGRDHSCDIRIVNKEISRKHAELYIENNAVFINSMGREPVSVNSKPITSPQELASGDKIEVHLDGRTRVFYFQGDDETVAIGNFKAPLGLVNANQSPVKSPAKTPSIKSAAKSAQKAKPADDDNDRKKMPPPPPPPLPKMNATAAGAAPAGRPVLPADLQAAIKAGIQLKKVNPTDGNQEDKDEVNETPAAPGIESSAPGKAAFCPNPADLLKLKASLRKTEGKDDDEEEEEQEEEAVPTVAEEQCQTVEEHAEADQQEEQQAMEEDVQPIPMSTAKKIRKAVRFNENAHSTPEGAAKDATITIRLRKGDLEQLVNIDDYNTVAFSEWGLGTMGPADGGNALEGEEEEDPLPDTVVSKKSRRASEAVSVGGSVMKQTPVVSKLESELKAAASALATDAGNKTTTTITEAPASIGPTPSALCRRISLPMSVIKGTTPAPAGAKAPAPTPATAGATASVQKKVFTAGAATMDPATLATRLAELAEENDVTFELPFDLFGATPFASAKKTINITVTPKSVRPTSASATKRVTNSALRSARKSTGGKNLPIVEESIDVVMEEEEQQQQQEEHNGMEVDKTLPLAEALMQEALLLEQQQQEGEQEEEALPATIEKSVPPPTSTRKSHGRRSMSRTPGTKIAIIERSYQPEGPSSVKPPRASSCGASVGAVVAPQPSPMVMTMSTMEEQEGVMKDIDDVVGQQESNEAQDESHGNEDLEVEVTVQNQEVEMLDGEDEEEDEDECVDGEDQVEAGAGAAAIKTVKTARPSGTSPVSASTYRKMVLKARFYRTQSLQLTAQLKGMTARASKLRNAASGLAAGLRHERSLRMELQNTLQQIIANREAAEELEQDEEVEIEDAVPAELEKSPMAEGADAMEVDNNETASEQQQPQQQQHVVVVGYSSPMKPCTTEFAGSVVVVRPNNNNSKKTPVSSVKRRMSVVVVPATTTKPATTTNTVPGTVGRSTRKTPAGKRVSSIRRTPAKTPGTVGTVIVDDVAVPEWVFDPEAGADASAELAVVDKEEQQQQQQVQQEEDGFEIELSLPATQEAEIDAVDEELDAALEGEEVIAVARPVSVVKQVQVQEEKVESEADDVDDEEEDDEDVCHLCGETDEGDVLLLCDGCDNACHLGCCKPVLKRVPKGDWFCVECTAAQKKKAAEESAPATKGGKGKQTKAAAPAPARGKKAAAVKEESKAAPKRGRPAAAAAPAETKPAAKRTKTSKAAAEETESKPTAAAKGKGTRRTATEAGQKEAPTRSTRSRR